MSARCVLYRLIYLTGLCTFEVNFTWYFLLLKFQDKWKLLHLPYLYLYVYLYPAIYPHTALESPFYLIPWFRPFSTLTYPWDDDPCDGYLDAGGLEELVAEVDPVPERNHIPLDCDIVLTVQPRRFFFTVYRSCVGRGIL